MSGAEVAVPATAAGVSALGGLAASGKGGGQSGFPSFFKRTAGKLGGDIRAALSVGQGGGRRFSFGPQGQLITNPGFQPTTLSRQALIQGVNFFANLFGNPDIEQALNFQRGVLSGEKLTDLGPLFEQVRERGLAQELEAGRRVGGLRSTGTGSRAADFLTRAEAQEAGILLGAQQAAAQALPDLLFRRGEASFLPSRVFAQNLGGGGGQLIPPAQFPNTKGQGFETAAGFVSQIPTGGKGKTTPLFNPGATV